MLFTIPYDKGWKAFIDDEPVKTEIYKDTFLSFPITAGSHKIKIVYTPQGFIPGLLVSIISIMILVFSQLLLRYLSSLKKKHPKPAGKPEEYDDDDSGEEYDPEDGQDENRDDSPDDDGEEDLQDDETLYLDEGM